MIVQWCRSNEFNDRFRALIIIIIISWNSDHSVTLRARVPAFTTSALTCVRRCSCSPQIKILKIQECPTWAEHLHNMICDVHSSMLNTPGDYALWGYKSDSLSSAFVPRLRRTSSSLITSSANFIKFNTIEDACATAVVEWSYLSHESDKVITTVEAPLYLT